MGSAVCLYTSNPDYPARALVRDIALEYHGDSKGWEPANNPVYVTGWFENETTNNHWLRDRHLGGNVDRGSGWVAISSYFEPSPTHVDVKCRIFGDSSGYRGPVVVWHDDYFVKEEFQNDIASISLSNGELDALGTTAIAKVLPTNPVSDLPTAIGELVIDGLPGALGAAFARSRRVTPDDISQEYLNYQFAISPFIRDMRAFGRATDKAKALIDEYRRKANKKIRRRYDFPVYSSTESTVYSNGGGYGCFLAGPEQSNVSGFLRPVLGGWPGTRTDTYTKLRKVWFSGAFTYHIPSGSDFASRLSRSEAEMRHIFGEISVDTAWNVLPYSWAADWISNAGDVIHNIASFARDGLVMPWGYVMEQCEFHGFAKVEGAVFGNQHPDYPYYSFPDVISTSWGAIQKRRRKATPFGFGLDPSGFTTRQWSILAALGVTRAMR